jgi:hypothetical protein
MESLKSLLKKIFTKKLSPKIKIDKKETNNTQKIDSNIFTIDSLNNLEAPIPKNIENLILRNLKNFKNEIPNSIEELIINDIKNFNKKIPNGIKKLVINYCDNFESEIPESITEIFVGYTKINKKLPNNLEILKLNRIFSFNQNIPNNLKILELSSCQNFKITLIHENIQELIINGYTNFNKEHILKIFKINPKIKIFLKGKQIYKEDYKKTTEKPKTKTLNFCNIF